SVIQHIWKSKAVASWSNLLAYKQLSQEGGGVAGDYPFTCMKEQGLTLSSRALAERKFSAL
uniref:Uncharacterized protein n=1 Tax=Varanus komodoensis TaxID=61221 RepID=A0A8D2Q610_VARKO